MVKHIDTLLLEREMLFERDRKRFSEAINEDVGAIFVSLQFHLDALKTDLSRHGVTGWEERLDAMSCMVTDSLGKVRSISKSLRPRMLDDMGLAAAVQWLGDDFERETEIITGVRVEGDDSAIAEPHRSILFRFFAELLRPSPKIAAKQVKITLRLTAEFSSFTVEELRQAQGKGVIASNMANMGVIKRLFAILGGKLQACGPDTARPRLCGRLPTLNGSKCRNGAIQANFNQFD